MQALISLGLTSDALLITLFPMDLVSSLGQDLPQEAQKALATFGVHTSSLVTTCVIIGHMVSNSSRSLRRYGPMSFTAQQTRLAVMIDTHVTQVLTAGGGDEALLLSLADHLGTFKQLLETCTSEEINALCDRYAGLYHFATLLEMLAEGIADGSIPASD
jgi:hypothetical protein